jgi:putative SOS response-associated peptidase YedK
MCFYSNQSKSAQVLQSRFNAQFENPALYIPAISNAFQYPKTPVITNKEPHIIHLYNWGLIPSWSKDDSIKKYTLNARIETITEKPAFRNSVNNRCLILADGFFEWQWLDEKGKQKQKYLLTLPNEEAFAFAGLFEEWADRQTGEIIHTYTVLTTAANELMSRIHNTKKRMPVIVSEENESDWLNGKELKMQNDRLVAMKD